jgi:hypothetical protein
MQHGQSGFRSFKTGNERTMQLHSSAHPDGFLALRLACYVLQKVTNSAPDGQHVTSGGDYAQLNKRTDDAVGVLPATHMT